MNHAYVLTGANHRGGGGSSAPEFGLGDANANCPPDFQKATALNSHSPNHVISSEKFIYLFSVGRDLVPSPCPSLMDPLLSPNQAFWIRLCVPHRIPAIRTPVSAFQDPKARRRRQSLYGIFSQKKTKLARATRSTGTTIYFEPIE